MHRCFPRPGLAALLVTGGMLVGAVLPDVAEPLRPSALAAEAPALAGDAYRHSFTAIEGHDLPLEQFRGQPILVVNTASFCGFTRQYAGLQGLWDRYRDQGLVVLGVPSGDFDQEMDDNAAIQSFCETTFGIDFPLTERVSVRGPASHPLFDHIRQELGAEAGPGWNFHKYLIAPDGRVVSAWPSRVEPLAPAVTDAIEALLDGTS